MLLTLCSSGNHTYNMLDYQKTLHFAHTLDLCVPYDFHNKQRLFPQRALIVWSLLWRRSVFCEVRTENLLMFSWVNVYTEFRLEEGSNTSTVALRVV
jgi:hypothetical protein